MLPKIRIKWVLAHIDRVLEVLGGVIMVLTFTSALSVSHAGKADVRAFYDLCKELEIGACDA